MNGPFGSKRQPLSDGVCTAGSLALGKQDQQRRGRAGGSGEGLAAHSSPRQRRAQECYFVTWWGIM